MGVEGVSFRGVSIEFSGQRFEDELEVCIDYDALDSAWRPGIISDRIGEDDDLSHYQPPPECLRVPQSAQLRTLGADGRIDAVALGVIRAAPAGSAAVLKKLATELRIDLPVATRSGTGRAELWWNNGTIVAHLFDEKFSLMFGSLTLRETVLPQTVITGAPGRMLRELVGMPFECNATIVTAEVYEGETHLRLEGRPRLVNCAKGQIL